MNDNEIIRYHIMKNKIYIIAEDINKNVIIYNVIKLKQIAIFVSSSINKITETLDKFDTTVMKSWFSVEIKVGCITIIFQKSNLFSNQYNFDEEYIEKILEATNNLQNIPVTLHKEVNFINQNQVDNSRISLQLNNFSQSASNFNVTRTTMQPTSNSKKTLSTLEKLDTLGGIFIIALFDNYVKNIFSIQKRYFDTNFIDPNNKIHGLIFNNSYNASYYMGKDKEKMESSFSTTTSTIRGNNKELKDSKDNKIKKDNEKDKDKSINNETNEDDKPLRIQNKYFIYSYLDSNITVGPSIDEMSQYFELPEFLKDIIKVVRYYVIKLNFNILAKLAN